MDNVKQTDIYRFAPGDTVKLKGTDEKGVVTDIKRAGFGTAVVLVVVYFKANKTTKTFLANWGVSADIIKTSYSEISTAAEETFLSLKKKRQEFLEKNFGEDFGVQIRNEPPIRQPLSPEEAVFKSTHSEKPQLKPQVASSIENLETPPVNRFLKAGIPDPIATKAAEAVKTRGTLNNNTTDSIFKESDNIFNFFTDEHNQDAFISYLKTATASGKEKSANLSKRLEKINRDILEHTQILSKSTNPANKALIEKRLKKLLETKIRLNNNLTSLTERMGIVEGEIASSTTLNTFLSSNKNFNALFVGGRNNLLTHLPADDELAQKIINASSNRAQSAGKLLDLLHTAGGIHFTADGKGFIPGLSNYVIGAKRSLAASRLTFSRVASNVFPIYDQAGQLGSYDIMLQTESDNLRKYGLDPDLYAGSIQESYIQELLAQDFSIPENITPSAINRQLLGNASLPTSRGAKNLKTISEYIRYKSIRENNGSNTSRIEGLLDKVESLFGGKAGIGSFLNYSDSYVKKSTVTYRGQHFLVDGLTFDTKTPINSKLRLTPIPYTAGELVFIPPISPQPIEATAQAVAQATTNDLNVLSKVAITDRLGIKKSYSTLEVQDLVLKDFDNVFNGLNVGEFFKERLSGRGKALYGGEDLYGSLFERFGSIVRNRTTFKTNSTLESLASDAMSQAIVELSVEGGAMSHAELRQALSMSQDGADPLSDRLKASILKNIDERKIVSSEVVAPLQGPSPISNNTVTLMESDLPELESRATRILANSSSAEKEKIGLYIKHTQQINNLTNKIALGDTSEVTALKLAKVKAKLAKLETVNKDILPKIKAANILLQGEVEDLARGIVASREYTSISKVEVQEVLQERILDYLSFFIRKEQVVGRFKSLKDLKTVRAQLRVNQITDIMRHRLLGSAASNSVYGVSASEVTNKLNAARFRVPIQTSNMDSTESHLRAVVDSFAEMSEEEQIRMGVVKDASGNLHIPFTHTVSNQSVGKKVMAVRAADGSISLMENNRPISIGSVGRQVHEISLEEVESNFKTISHSALGLVSKQHDNTNLFVVSGKNTSSIPMFYSGEGGALELNNQLRLLRSHLNNPSKSMFLDIETMPVQGGEARLGQVFLGNPSTEGVNYSVHTKEYVDYLNNLDPYSALPPHLTDPIYTDKLAEARNIAENIASSIGGVNHSEISSSYQKALANLDTQIDTLIGVTSRGTASQLKYAAQGKLKARLLELTSVEVSGERGLLEHLSATAGSLKSKVLVGNNLKFDLGVLSEAFTRHGNKNFLQPFIDKSRVLDFQAVQSFLFPVSQRDESLRYKSNQDDLGKLVFGDKYKQTHDATLDSRDLSQILSNDSSSTFNQLNDILGNPSGPTPEGNIKDVSKEILGRPIQTKGGRTYTVLGAFEDAPELGKAYGINSEYARGLIVQESNYGIPGAPTAPFKLPAMGENSLIEFIEGSKFDEQTTNLIEKAQVRQLASDKIRNSIYDINHKGSIIETLYKNRKRYEEVSKAIASAGPEGDVFHALNMRAENLLRSSNREDLELGGYIKNWMLTNNQEVKGSRNIAQFMQLGDFFKEFDEVHEPFIKSLSILPTAEANSAVNDYFKAYYVGASTFDKTHFDLLGKSQYEEIIDFTKSVGNTNALDIQQQILTSLGNRNPVPEPAALEAAREALFNARQSAPSTEKIKDAVDILSGVESNPVREALNLRHNTFVSLKGQMDDVLSNGYVKTGIGIATIAAIGGLTYLALQNPDLGHREKEERDRMRGEAAVDKVEDKVVLSGIQQAERKNIIIESGSTVDKPINSNALNYAVAKIMSKVVPIQGIQDKVVDRRENINQYSMRRKNNNEYKV